MRFKMKMKMKTSLPQLLILCALVIALGPLANAQSTTHTLYFNPDSIAIVGVTGYLLDTDYANTAVYINSSQDGASAVQYGFRVYLVTSASAKAELTPGEPAALITLTGNVTGQVSSTLDVSAVNVVLGYQSLEVVVYERYSEEGSWLSRANFLTPALVTNKIQEATWTFQLYVNYTVTESSTFSGFLFGNSQYTSCISGVQLAKPSQNDLQAFRINQGDVVGFVIGAYTDVIGAGAHLLVLLCITGALWFNHRNVGVVMFLFVIFGGSGGVIWLFVPPWAATVVCAVLIVMFAALLYKVTRG